MIVAHLIWFWLIVWMLRMQRRADLTQAERRALQRARCVGLAPIPGAERL